MHYPGLQKIKGYNFMNILCVGSLKLHPLTFFTMEPDDVDGQRHLFQAFFRVLCVYIHTPDL